MPGEGGGAGMLTFRVDLDDELPPSHITVEFPCAHLRVSLIVTCGIAKRLEFTAGLETEELEDEHWSGNYAKFTLVIQSTIT